MRCDHPDHGHTSRAQGTQYVINYPEGRLTVHLCRRHAEPLTGLKRALKVVAEPKARIKRGLGTRPISPAEL